MWRFVQVTDPHLASEQDGRWNNDFLCTMMPEVMRCLRQDLQALAPEFILATGDIVSTQTRDAMFAARDLMDSLEIPYYPMGGNHDFVLEQSRAWFLEAFKHRLPEQRTYYAFTHKNLRFVVLDPWWLWSDGSLNQVSEAAVAAELDRGLEGARWAVPPEQLIWLDETLADDTQSPTIIAVHYPLIRIPDRMRRPGMQDGGAIDNGDDIIAILKHHPQVKAVFSGHVHTHFVERIDGFTQVVTGALPEYPTEYRMIDVHNDRLEVVTKGLSDGSFAARSLIPGKEWLSGEPEDRTAVIPLI